MNETVVAVCLRNLLRVPKCFEGNDIGLSEEPSIYQVMITRNTGVFLSSLYDFGSVEYVSQEEDDSTTVMYVEISL